MKKSSIIILFLCLVAMGYSQQDSTQKQTTNNPYQDVLIKDMDKMLDLWYVKKEVANASSVLSKVKDDTLSTVGNDSIIELQLKKLATIVPVVYNQRVRTMINLYLNRKRSSSAILGLAQYYYPWMKEIFDKHDVPEELIYLTIIESSLNPQAVSRAGATGIWQFMYTTGKMYDLHVNTFVDDRRDPVKATEAAARHLKDLYGMFNDWGLAIAAYNCGPGNVRKAIQRSGGKNTFWGVINYLPKETQNYFPAFIGAYFMMEYHNQYGIKAARITIPTAVDTIMVTKELHLEQVAQVLNIDLEELKTLNPQYKRDVVPAFTKPYPLKLRTRDIPRFITLQDSIHKYKYDTYFAPLQNYVNVFTGTNNTQQEVKKKYHTVKSGETLSKIAIKYGLSVEELKKMNKLSSNYIQPKKRLVVGYETIVQPTPTGTTCDSTKAAVNSTEIIKETPTPASNSTLYHVVKKGETMNSIAMKYHTTVSKIATANHITDINKLSVGQKLKIPSK